MSLISFDNTEYTTSSTTTVPLPRAMKLICKCKRNLELDNNDDRNDGENVNKIQCLEENCVTRKSDVSNGHCDDWHPLNGTRYIELSDMRVIALEEEEKRRMLAKRKKCPYLLEFAEPTIQFCKCFNFDIAIILCAFLVRIMAWSNSTFTRIGF